ncbi:MAG TPA: NrfD/PsrC family molybdoenzyme membrane anchor subunit [Vicinamibacterales bacterium]|nr:NrfD/PsrC family molybdoenzyme membrane anchor subunit [Vicinamibacterales bacterium]
MTTTYYDVPLLKGPVWTWEVPLYFFVGGAAGGAALIGSVARWSGTNGTLARDATWVAAAGGPISAALLTADLGRPERFVNMLRVFKPQSAMSVGSWTLTAFSASSTAALVPALSPAASAASAALGAGMLTYTGVLIGATAIPVWHENVRLLPAHFAASGIGSAAALLTLMGHDEPALNDLAIGAAAAETLIGAALESRAGAAMAPLREGASGWIVRCGGVLSGPVPLILRAASRKRSWRTVASLAALAGALLTRFGWIAAGRASSRQKPSSSRVDS